MGLEFSKERTGEFQARLFVCLLAIIGFFLIVFVRLFYLQIAKGRQFAFFSMENTMKEIKIPASRGVIFDRNHISMVENRPSFDLILVPQQIRDIDTLKGTLEQVAGIDPSVVTSKWKSVKRQAAFLPVEVADDISYDQAVRLRVSKSAEIDDLDPTGLRGVEVTARTLRSYPQGPVAAATIGHIGEINEKDLARFQKDEPGRYSLGDIVGASGIEKRWDKILRGRDGHELKVVDAVGREIFSEDLGEFQRREDPVNGDNLVLTLDSRLQKFAEERFEGKSGGLVALDPKTGEVLAMVSVPSYDPAKLVSNVSPQYWTTLVTDPQKLMLNRATQGAYPPGSTYKIVTALAGLEEGVIKPDETISCHGGLQYGGRFFKCWNKGGHGAISVRQAIPQSCDTFFYITGLRLGVDRLAKYANMLGLGLKTGVDLDGEKAGTIPTAEWKKKLFGQEWHAGENISISVGQGYDTATPLQNALMVAQVGVGKKLKPHLFKRLEDPAGRVIREWDGPAPEPLPISAAHLDIVRAAMADTVKSPSGTAHRVASKYFTMAGKTGTAQVMSEEAKGRAKAGVKTGDHAWFVAISPADQPEIAVSVIVEHGGFGASAAAPVARDVIEKFFELQGKLHKEEPAPVKSRKKKTVRKDL